MGVNVVDNGFVYVQPEFRERIEKISPVEENVSNCSGLFVEISENVTFRLEEISSASN